jgi:hypothetical protein
VLFLLLLDKLRYFKFVQLLLLWKEIFKERVYFFPAASFVAGTKSEGEPQQKSTEVRITQTLQAPVSIALNGKWFTSNKLLLMNSFYVIEK